MMCINDIFINFVTSYIAGAVPSLKNILSRNDDKKLQCRIDECYQKALEHWTADDTVRERIARLKFFDVNQLQVLYIASEWEKDALAIKHLTDLWVEELRKDEVCAHYIQEQEIKAVGDKVDKLRELLMTRDVTVATQYKLKGLTKHKTVEGYIRRYCSSDKSENNFINYILEKGKARIGRLCYWIGRNAHE